MNKLWMAISVSLLGHILAWFHMQAQFKWTWASNTWWIAIGGIPISYAFFYGTKWYYDFFGNYWYVRPIGFGMATIVFTFLTWLVLHELPDTRTIISLIFIGSSGIAFASSIIFAIYKTQYTNL